MLKKRTGIGRVFAVLMSFMLIVTSFNIAGAIKAYAAISCTLKISCAQGMEVPGNYGIEYNECDAEGNSTGSNGWLSGNSDGSEASAELSAIGSEYIKIKVQSAGKDIFINGSCDNSWDSGKVIAVSELAAEYQFQLQPPQGNQPSDPQDPQDPPSGPAEAVNLTINWQGEFGDIAVGGYHIDASGATSGSETFTEAQCDGDNINISVVAPFTMVFSSLKVDGSEKLSSNADTYDFTIPKTNTTVSIVSVVAGTGSHTIVWAYDDEFGADALVEHGKVEVISGAENHGERHYLAQKDSVVTIKLIPDYGYQVVGAKINGDIDLTAGTNVNVFSFSMPNTNVHFQGIFTSTEDIVSNSSSAVSGASFAGNAVASTGGTAKMTIANATPSDTSVVTQEIDTSKDVQAVDITMDQLFYKNSAESIWTEHKTELGSAAQVELTVKQAADGYAVLREHEGSVEEIASNYDESTNKITFASDKYSTYTLVPLKTANNTYTEEETKPASSDAPSGTSITTGGKSDVTVQEEKEEVVKDIKTISTDKTAVSELAEQAAPQTAYNMSAYKTVKGFLAGIDKISKNNQGKVIEIYTDKPICFSRYILESIKKTNATFVYYFMSEGHLYRITISAGADISKLLESNGFAGPLYIGKQLGTSVLVK